METKDITKGKIYLPCPGFILILPFEKDKKSDYVAVQDNVDKSYKGTVIAVGDPIISDYGVIINPPVIKGQTVLYSIAGSEETKMEWKDNPRERFIIAPFRRILLVIE